MRVQKEQKRTYTNDETKIENRITNKTGYISNGERVDRIPKPDVDDSLA